MDAKRMKAKYPIVIVQKIDKDFNFLLLLDETI